MSTSDHSALDPSAQQTVIIKEKPTLLLVIRHPIGGIRTYLKYVYGQPCFADYKLIFLIAAKEEIANSFKAYLHDLGATIIVVDDDIKALARCTLRQIWKLQPSLVHSHGLTSALLSAIPAKVLGIPHISTPHSPLTDADFPGTKGLLKKFAMQRILKLLDVIQPVSKCAEKNLNEFLPSVCKGSTQILPILNGIDTEHFFNAQGFDFKNKLPETENRTVFGFLGRFMPEKGFNLIIEAAHTLKENPVYTDKFCIVAVGEGDYIRETKREVKNKDLENHIYFLPFSNDIAPILKSLDCVLMPSRWEACPLLPMETLTAGTPLIASDCEGVLEVVTDSPTMIIPSNNVQSLLEKMKQIMESSAHSSFQAYAATAKTRYDVANTAHQLETVYRKLIKKAV